MTKGKKILAHAVLILASFLSVFPLYYMLCGATNPSIDVVRGKLIPGTYLMENFKSLIANQNLGLAMANSFRNAILMTFITLLVCSIAGYGFEIYHDKAKDALMSVLLLAMMLPFVAIMIPLFKMMSHWGLVNSWAAFVLPSISTPFMIMLFRQASMSFPNDIIEAARLDGLSEIGIFFRMFVPIMRSTYGAAMTVTFMNAWNSYLWPKIIFQNNASITMPMLVANLKSGYSVDYGHADAGCPDLHAAHCHHLPLPAKELCQRHYGCSQMTARDVCLSPAEWENALVQLQLAKQLGLIDDASPEALEARRQAKNAENARLQTAGTVFYGPRQYTPAMYLQYELTRFKLDFAQPTAAIRALPVCPVITEEQKQAYYRN